MAKQEIEFDCFYGLEDGKIKAIIDVPDGYEVDPSKTTIYLDEKPSIITTEILRGNNISFEKGFDGVNYGVLGVGLEGLKKLSKLTDLYSDKKSKKCGYSCGEDELYDLISEFNNSFFYDDGVKYTKTAKDLVKMWHKDLSNLISKAAQENGISEEDWLNGRKLMDPDTINI